VNLTSFLNKIIPIPRFQTRGCIVTTRNDQLFIASGTRKRGFALFNKPGVTNSYATALRKNTELAENHDAPVLKWKEEHEQEHREIKKMIEENGELTYNEARSIRRLNHEAPTEYQVNIAFHFSEVNNLNVQTFADFANFG